MMMMLMMSVGPTDPGLSSALPRRPLPEILVKDLIKNIPNISFASNPCRIRFFTQEIVIYRSVLLDHSTRPFLLLPVHHYFLLGRIY
jgi:DNA polymerase epsilon subunit 2